MQFKPRHAAVFAVTAGLAASFAIACPASALADAVAAPVATQAQSQARATEGNAVDVVEFQGVAYPTVQEAINAASRLGAPATVKLLANTAECVTVSSGDVTLDLNGFTLSNVSKSGESTVKVSGSSTVFTLTGAGRLTFDSSSSQNAAIYANSGQVNIKGAAVELDAPVDGSASRGGYAIMLWGGNLSVSADDNGTRSSITATTGNYSTVRKQGEGSMSFENCDITGYNSTAIVSTYCTLDVKNGTVITTSKNERAIEHKGYATISGGKITGEVFTQQNASYQTDPDPVLNITGGTIDGKVICSYTQETYDAAKAPVLNISGENTVITGAIEKRDSSKPGSTIHPQINIEGGIFGDAAGSADAFLQDRSAKGLASNGDGTYSPAALAVSCEQTVIADSADGELDEEGVIELIKPSVNWVFRQVTYHVDADDLAALNKAIKAKTGNVTVHVTAEVEGAPAPIELGAAIEVRTAPVDPSDPGTPSDPGKPSDPVDPGTPSTQPASATTKKKVSKKSASLPRTGDNAAVAGAVAVAGAAAVAAGAAAAKRRRVE